MRKQPRQIVTHVEIAASPEVVWDVVTDVGSYSRWNPFVVEGTGSPDVGAQLTLRMRAPGGPSIPLRPRVTESARPSTFEWLGHLGVRGVFDGRHRFDIQRTDSGSMVTHSEEFRGLLVPVMSNFMDDKTRAGFESMNAALKERAERIAVSGV